MIWLARDGSERVMISASPMAAIADGANDKAAVEAKGPRMKLSACVFDAFHKDAASCVGAATEGVRARFYVSYLSTGEATVTLSHRLAAALRSLPVE